MRDIQACTLRSSLPAVISSRKGEAVAGEDSCVSVQRSSAGVVGGSDGSGAVPEHLTPWPP